MSNLISFATSSELRPYSLNDQICFEIQPLIQKLLDNFVISGNLDNAIAKAVQEHPESATRFFEWDINAHSSSFSLKEEFLFPPENPLLKIFYKNNTTLKAILGHIGVKEIEDESELPEIKKLIYLCAQSRFTYDEICEQLDSKTIELLAELKRWKVITEQPYIPPKEDFKHPGIYRLQHAALLYRSSTTGILVDPHLHSNYGIRGIENDITRAQLEGYVDAILISHSHYDHWHCPTLMMFPADTLIIVPKVPRNSITCEDMEDRLKSLGFTNVRAVDWYSDAIAIGDMEINVLPFYGEQTIVPEYPNFLHPDLRNWGNTYMINTPDYSSWFLIDAGQEPGASMKEVAVKVKQKFGKVDSIISNFQALSYNSIGTDLSSWGIDIVGNLLTNPQIFFVTNKTEGSYTATLSPQGVAEICAIVEAESCLPYADSWAEIGSASTHDCELIQQTEAELKNLDCATKVIPWKIGDRYLPKSKVLT